MDGFCRDYLLRPETQLDIFLKMITNGRGFTVIMTGVLETHTIAFEDKFAPSTLLGDWSVNAARTSSMFNFG